jgi:hypothetical protein
MPLIRQKPPPPSWAKQYGRSFLDLIPQMLGVAGGSALQGAIRGAIGEHFQKKKEGREYEREKEEWARKDEAGRKAQQKQYDFLRGMEEQREGARLERQQIRDVTRSMEDLPEEQAKYAGAPKTYQSPATKMTGEAMKGIVPQMVSAGVGAMTAMPFTGRETAAPEEGFPEPKPKTDIEQKMHAATRQAKEMGIPPMPVRPEEAKKWEPPQRLGGAPGVQPGALAGAGTAAMLGKAFEPEGTMEAGAREAGIAMRGRPKAEGKMTAAQRNARDTVVQRRKAEDRYFQLKKIVERGNISIQQKKYAIQEMRTLQNAIYNFRRQEHDYSVAGIIPGEIDMPEVRGAPQFEVGKGLKVETIQPDPTEGLSQAQVDAYKHYVQGGASPADARKAAMNVAQ